MKNYIITIARGFGSGGKEIGTKLSAELNIPCYEKQILEMASEKSGLEEKLFDQVDEKLRGSFIANKLAKFTYNFYTERTAKNFISDDNLFHIQAEIIRELAKTQSCIIIGKCADYVLKDYDNVLSVYVEAPRAACVESIVHKLKVSEKEAHQLIEKTDKYRADYYKYYTGGNYWTNPVNYDITLNSDRVGRDNCVQVIRDMLQIKLGIEL